MPVCLVVHMAAMAKDHWDRNGRKEYLLGM